MTSFFAKYWKTFAIASVSLTSSYLYCHDDNYRLNNRLLSLLTVQAAEYERRNAGKASFKNQYIEPNKNIDDNDDDNDDNDDDDDDDEEDDDKNDWSKTEKNIIGLRERRFHDFASLEYNGEIYMTPVDFLESVIIEHPRPRLSRRQLTDEMVETILYNTPPKHRGSKTFFRNLENDGLISFMEYLFLWVVLTKPTRDFKIGFAMFDTDDNQLIEKREFLLLGRAMSDKRMLRRPSAKYSTPKSNASQSFHSYFNLISLIGHLFSSATKKHSIKKSLAEEISYFDDISQVDTTLLLHFFGKNGRDTLNYIEFKRFAENVQTEVLEMEFAQFSHGFKTISELGFAEILLRYADFDPNTKKSILKELRKSCDKSNEITFEQFRNFFEFLNNLEEFSIAMRFHQLSDKPISPSEFQRAVKISTGFELELHVITLIFRMFDADDDQNLSYEEFMAVMKDRLSRSFQAYNSHEKSISKFDQFKRCFRERAKSKVHHEKPWLGLWKK